jgi:hypothetical protein
MIGNFEFGYRRLRFVSGDAIPPRAILEGAPGEIVCREVDARCLSQYDFGKQALHPRTNYLHALRQRGILNVE